jgi:hypothetical protein
MTSWYCSVVTITLQGFRFVQFSSGYSDQPFSFLETVYDFEQKEDEMGQHTKTIQQVKHYGHREGAMKDSSHEDINEYKIA